jgi:hypothetical protein
MKDLGIPKEKRWELISNCDINKYWSAMIGVFRGQVRGWFCEIAGAQSILHQDDPCKMCNGEGIIARGETAPICNACEGTGKDYPDTGIPIKDASACYSYSVGDRKVRVDHWWELPMTGFADQVRKHCHECGVPLRGHGELAMSKNGKEQVSETHKDIFVTKRRDRKVELVTVPEQLGNPLGRMTDYLGNVNRQ